MLHIHTYVASVSYVSKRHMAPDFQFSHNKDNLSDLQNCCSDKGKYIPLPL